MNHRPHIAVTLAALMVSVVSACVYVRIYQPTDGPGDPTGSVKPLRKLVGKDGEPITVVFVHGVSDYCRGYAVGNEDPKYPEDDQTAWLNPNALRFLHLTRIEGSQSDTQLTARQLEVAGLGPHDSGPDPGPNLILIREMDYRWTPRGGQTIRVHAVEVTWSPMTRWIKNTMLGYDEAKTAVFHFIHGGSGVDPLCTHDKPDQIGRQTPAYTGFSPPRRVAVNANLKWEVLDRDLADAVIYAGTYGPAMQRGMAVVLCRIFVTAERPPKVMTNDSTVPCQWPQISKMQSNHFIFVTHSLGSRLL